MDQRLLLAAFVGVLLFVPPVMLSQPQPAAAFEIVSIKPTPKERLNNVKRECTGDRFYATGFPFAFHVEWSYGFVGDRLTGLPEWTSDWSLAYEIEAKASAPMSVEQCKALVRTLLEDRFKMKVRRETKEMRAYALVVGKNGSRMRDVTADATGPGVKFNGAQHQTVADKEPPKGISMSYFSRLLSDWSAVGLPVVDRTGLPGIYSFELSFFRTETDDRPSIFTAVQQQLGLKLEPVKAPLEVLVVDHVEKASLN